MIDDMHVYMKNELFRGRSLSTLETCLVIPAYGASSVFGMFCSQTVFLMPFSALTNLSCLALLIGVAGVVTHSMTSLGIESYSLIGQDKLFPCT
ncbi:hypothetical protein BDV29DRAFT_113191 [Aspergillus leporis]|uniref:Uncharacterized protein n=1 Tax=Aspergillus leporis TaxID=41062 RepID=A0A5N5X3C4_9EURO|nr:hypothetical protein BDV29DRAFT_113191 [Aspergillus leporis]